MKIVNGNIELDNKDVVEAVINYCKKTFPQLTYKDINNITAKSEGPVQSLNSPNFNITIYIKSSYKDNKKRKFTLFEKLNIINTILKKIRNSDDDEHFNFF